MNSENAFDLQQDRSVKLWSACPGSAFSGELRGLLTAHLANGESRLSAECVSAQEACKLAQLLNRAHHTPEQIRNAEARRECEELKALAEMLPGRDNKNNWVKKLDWIKMQFQDDDAPGDPS